MRWTIHVKGYSQADSRHKNQRSAFLNQMMKGPRIVSSMAVAYFSESEQLKCVAGNGVRTGLALELAKTNAVLLTL